MRRFDLYHCLGNQLCTRILQLTKRVARAERANRARRLGMPKATLFRQLQKTSYSKHTLQLAFFHLCLWLRGLTGNHASVFPCSDSTTTLQPLLIQAEKLPTSHWSAGRFPKLLGVHFSLTALLLVVFDMSWHLKNLSINYLTTPSDLKMKQIESRCFFDHKTLSIKSMHCFSSLLFWTSSGISGQRDHTGCSLEVCFQPYRVRNKNVLLQAQKAACNFRDCPVQSSEKLDFLKPLADRANEPAFLSQTTNFTLFENFKIIVSGCLVLARAVSVLVSYRGHRTHTEQYCSLWHVTPDWETVPVKPELHS